VSRFSVANRRRETVGQGVGDGFSQALELVAGPLVFGFLGWLLDAKLGTSPLFAVVFAVFGVLGAVVAQYFRYMDRIRRQDEGRPWTRRRVVS
jgi:F0F1-type ATP synthase assembly protein I